MGSSPLLSTVNLESLRIYSVIPTDNLKKNAKYSDKNPIKKRAREMGQQLKVHTFLAESVSSVPST